MVSTVMGKRLDEFRAKQVGSLEEEQALIMEELLVEDPILEEELAAMEEEDLEAMEGTLEVERASPELEKPTTTPTSRTSITPKSSMIRSPGPTSSSTPAGRAPPERSGGKR